MVVSQEPGGKLGTKVSEDKLKGLDPTKIGKNSAFPPAAEVEGQMLYEARQICPWCGAIGYGVESTDTVMYFTCHNCGGTFTA